MPPFALTLCLGFDAAPEMGVDATLRRVAAIRTSRLSQALYRWKQADNPELRQRLEREAKAISGLTHPNICTLHELGHDGGVDYLVMEYLKGETLAERLRRGPMSIDESMGLAIEIADALESAHRAGIVHRDIKPSNIMLTREGGTLLDFGLAKADAPVVGEPASLSDSPTASQPLTAAGTVLGTYQYIAPEQLEGKRVDARTDIFAFGAVLYEMVTGRRAFGGDSRASLIGEIMHAQPQLASSIQPTMPPALDRVIQACLAKDPEDRWQTAHDVKLQLQWIAEDGSAAGFPAQVVVRRRYLAQMAWAALAVATVAITTLVAVHVRQAPRPTHQTRLHLLVPSDLTRIGSPRISPDGRIVAFRGIHADGTTDLWLRPLDTLEAYPLAGSEGMIAEPIWSPSSQHIAFFAGTKLKRIAVAGGPPLTICEAESGADGTWNTLGEILFDNGRKTSLMLVADTGGIPKQEAKIDHAAGEISVMWPEFLPDGRHYLYVVEYTDGERNLMLRSLDREGATFLARTDSRAQFVEPRHLLLVRGGALVAIPFDHRAREIDGEPKPLAEAVWADSLGGADFSSSQSGSLVYQSRSGGTRQLTLRDRSGRELGTVGDSASYGEVSLSPAGDRVVTGITDPRSGSCNLWILDLERGVPSRLTFGRFRDLSPLWSPDGTRIFFSSDRTGSLNLFTKAASGGGDAEQLLADSQTLYADGISQDNKFLVYVRLDPETDFDIWAMPLDRSTEPFPVVRSSYFESWSDLSSDGKWLAYQSSESGDHEVFVRSFPKTGGKWQISDGGGYRPRWNANGREIFYVDPVGRLMSVAVEVGRELRFGKPEYLFDTGWLGGNPYRGYAVTPDGERFLVNTPVEDELKPPITVVLNWAASNR